LALTPNFNAQPPWSILAQWVLTQRISSIIFTTGKLAYRNKRPATRPLSGFF
jgi:hypothetical protein